MNNTHPTKNFQNTPIDIKIQLAFMWTSLLFCYIYCDYFNLYPPGKIEEMMTGKHMLHHPWKLFAASVLMAVPSLMIFLSVTLPAKWSKIFNISFGLFYALFLGLILFSLDLEWYKFYIFFAIIEIALASFIVYKAYHWPKVNL